MKAHYRSEFNEAQTMKKSSKYDEEEETDV